jgi:transposase
MPNCILWVLRTGAPWRDLHERYPPYQGYHRRFQRWIEEGVLGSVLEALALDLQERVQIDLSAIKGWRRAVRIRKTLEERRCGAGSLALAERPVPLAQ